MHFSFEIVRLEVENLAATTIMEKLTNPIRSGDCTFSVQFLSVEKTIQYSPCFFDCLILLRTCPSYLIPTFNFVR